METASVLTRHFPWTLQLGTNPVVFRLMTPEDRDGTLEFVNTLPAQDLFYLMHDIRDPQEMNRLIDGIREHHVTTVLAESRGRLLGYGSLTSGHLPWTRHLGEVRLLVAPDQRGKGLGTILAKEVFAVAHDLGLRRIVARLTSKQISARYLFQHLGFHIEAVLAECVIDNEGHAQDLMIMSYDLTGFHLS